MINCKELTKIILCQVLAVLLSILLVNYVFWESEAKVRQSFKNAFYNSSKKIAAEIKNTPNAIRGKAEQISYIVTRRYPIAMPPPWSMPDTSYPYPPEENGQRETVPTVPPVHQPTSPVKPTTYSPYPTTSYPQPTTDNRQPTTPPAQQPTTPPLPTPTPLSPTLPSYNSLTSEEQGAIDEINRRRQEIGLSTLSVNQQLVSAARRHSKDMSKQGFCGHSGSDGSDPFQRAKEAGFTGRIYGETVACGYSTSQAVVDAWWKSSGHKAILTNNRITLIGLGWWSGPNRTTAVVGY